MRITRQGKNTERRIVVTLARHERNTEADKVIAKLNKSKNWREVAPEFGAVVKYESKPGHIETLYYISADKFQ